jgi:glycerol kinase
MAAMTYLLALDQGTTSSRAIVFSMEGTVVATAQQEFQQHYPKPGWVEHNADEIWESQLAVTRQAIRRAGIEVASIAAIGITNQRETTVVWDRRTGRPVSRAIVWQDRRTAELCQSLRADGHAQMVQQKTGLVLDPYFSATKLHWMLKQQPALRKRADAGELCFGTIDSWLIYKLTGGEVHATDVTNAARTLLMNIHTLQWDEQLLELFEIPPSMLPRITPSSAMIGKTDAALLGSSVPIAGVAGDQQSALFGQACFSPGMAKNTYGTGSFIVMNTGEKAIGCSDTESSPDDTGRPPHGVLSTVAWQLENSKPHYALEASIFVTGAAVQWLRDGLGLIKTSAEIEDLAASVDDSGGVYFVPALTGLGSPHWDANARGTIVGITRGTTAAHLARATLEAIAYQTCDGIHAMNKASGIALKELRVDGGAAINDMLMQFQADMLDTPVVRPRVTETTALGAASLAGLGVGVLDLEQIQSQWQLGKRFEPAMEQSQRNARYQQWQRAVDRSRGWVE